MEFNPGDLVQCVDASLTLKEPLRHGRIYRVRETVHGSGEQLLFLYGHSIARNASRFVPAEEATTTSWSHWGMVLGEHGDT